MSNKYTKENLQKIILKNISMAGVIRDFGLKQTGGSQSYLTKKAKEWNIDTSHFMGQAHLRGKTHTWSPKIPIQNFLIKNSHCHRTNLKNRLIKENILKNECNICGQQPDWKGKSLIMILDHINGVNNDNRKENLRLLCPNCNAQQTTFCGRNLKTISDQKLLDLINKEGIKNAAKKIGITEGGVRYRLNKSKHNNI